MSESADRSRVRTAEPAVACYLRGGDGDAAIAREETCVGADNEDITGGRQQVLEGGDGAGTVPRRLCGQQRRRRGRSIAYGEGDRARPDPAGYVAPEDGRSGGVE